MKAIYEFKWDCGQMGENACDLCGTSGEKISVRKCFGCNKDICNQRTCSTWLQDNPWSGENDSRLTCLACHSKLMPFKVKANAIREASEKEIDGLEQEWKKLVRPPSLGEIHQSEIKLIDDGENSEDVINAMRAEDV